MTRASPACVLLLVAAVVPAGGSAQSVALRYWLTPNPESGTAVEQALLEFGAWMREGGDSWRWNLYQVVAGDELGSWVLRSSRHTWAELDSRVRGFAPLAAARFESTILPLLASATLQFEELDEDLSRRPDQSTATSIFHITEWDLEPNGEALFDEAIASMMQSHDQAGSPYYATYYKVTASNGNTVRRSRNFPNWVGFTTSPKFGQPLEGAYGAERAAEVWNLYGAAVRATKDFVLRSRPVG